MVRALFPFHAMQVLEIAAVPWTNGMAFGRTGQAACSIARYEPRETRSTMRPQLPLLLFTALFTTAAMAQDTRTRGTNDPHGLGDGSWIGIAGHVESTSPGSFVLDYGDGTIKVGLEPSSTRQHEFIQDEQVRVYGVVDGGFFKAKTIQAHAVYVESLKTYACTTEGAEPVIASFAPTIFSGVVIHGRVTQVSKDNITVDEGDRQIVVDTGALDTASGAGMAPAAKVGDVVTVLGHMDEGLFSRKLKAGSLEVVR
jgi:hypothetical protein